MTDTAMLGSSGYTRLSLDAYDTIGADWIVPALLEQTSFPSTVWEPAAGSGHMVDALSAAGKAVLAHDIAPRRADIAQADFFAWQHPPQGIRAIVTNPPYREIDDFARYALRLMMPHRGKVALLVRSEWTHAKARKDIVHDHAAFAGQVALTKRPRWFADGGKSPRHNFSWVVWDWNKAADADPWLKFSA